MEKNILLQIEYDGTGFSGWQRQPGKRTVQGVLESVITDLVAQGEALIPIEGLSRTDAGVHAKAQMATVKYDIPMPAANFKKALNDRLSGRPEAPGENSDIRIVSAKEVPEGFRVRQEAAGKKYVYSIYNGKEMPVFLRHQRYHVADALDVGRMREVAEHIKGKHDFACFQASGGEPGSTTVRTVTDLVVTEKPAGGMEEEDAAGSAREITIEIAGDGFLYNMVRIIAGTLVEVGLGKRDPGEVEGIIESRDRTKAGHTAPPQGLCLEEAYLRTE